MKKLTEVVDVFNDKVLIELEVLGELQDELEVESVEEARKLKVLFHPQKVRNNHIHRGTLLAGELLTHDYFKDPTFDEMLRTLDQTARICLIEWLRGKGKFNFKTFEQ